MMALTGEDTWDLDLDIEVMPNLWVRNDDIEAQFEGDLQLIRRSGVSRFLGELEIIRGRAFLFDKTFQLEPGGRVIFRGGDTLNPDLDIIARTRIPGPFNVGDDDEAAPIDLAVHVGGTLNYPEITPVVGSDYSREDILPLIVANYYGGSQVRTGSVWGARAASYLSSQVSQITSGQLRQFPILSGISTFEIDPTSTGELDLSRTTVTVGINTLPQMYVYGRSTPGAGQYGQEVGFEYRFSRSLMLEGLNNELNEYMLNLKLHLEF
jgi:autotransporter translocation and assembly factor TamB